MVLREPLLLKPSPRAKIWGGDALSGFLGLDFETDGPVGEVWTLFDREGSSTEIAGGEFAGRTLRGLMLSEQSALLGSSKASPEGAFPLLVKLLDANRDLSIQVHPDSKRAQILGAGAEGKDEFWYILAAAEGARIYLGLLPGVDPKAFAECADSSDVTEYLQEFPIKKGDCVWVPAGTIHSIGAGITLVEVQQNSDTTYRMYDWGRNGLDGKPRTCHVDEALQAVDYEAQIGGPQTPELSVEGVNPMIPLVDTGDFSVEQLSVHAPMEHNTAGRAWVYMVLSGKGRLTLEEGEGEWSFHRGETWLLPASLGGYRFDAPDGDFVLLRIEVKAESQSEAPGA